ncbi:unnamed protein product [Adineta steineri]|uniref:Adenylate kinase active site lid domain-containing protein n=1 Tax=Adineta steineri TaxID=433720 RepID=A0A818S974_9BILA|nr:unnamed protein product [Adineta steineri]CAF3660144.1 unnamed protein product [Adineta steineri]
MPLSSTSSINNRSENDEQIQTIVKNNDSQAKSDIGANIVLIGAPGSGKGTQSTRLVDRYQICHISTGDLLRQAAQDKTSVEGQKIRETIEAGNLVDDDTVISLIEKNLTKPECHNGVLFDGFPRTIYQGEQLEKLLQSKQKHLDAVLEYAIEDDLLKRRILGRLIHKPSGRTYHEEFHPPKEAMKDDITGEILERRSDDTNETLNARLKTYHKQTTPLIEFYRQRNIHRLVDATQKISEISKQSIENINHLRQQSASITQQIPARQTYDDGKVLKIKSLPNQLDVDKNRLSNNFLFIYNSVTSVLRDRGII